MRNYVSAYEIKVGLNFGDQTLPVGRLAIRERKIYFEYDRTFIERRLELSPLRLPLGAGIRTFDNALFEGLPGLFNDSLPDGWGRLLVDRFSRSDGLLPSDLTALDRLAHVGTNGMGALVYEPDYSFTESGDTVISLDRLSEAAQDILSGTSSDVLQELIALNGSSAGARPKAMVGLDEFKTRIIHGLHHLPPDYEAWIVKFANSQDGTDAGAIEYVYALMAKDAGLEMPDIHLFPAQHGSGYFAVKRFDRNKERRRHMHTACGLLHSDFRTPSLDYEDLVALTGALTRDIREVEKMVQRAIFNVLAYNRDDHSKNFSFLMNETGQWKLSPAYDITFSSGPNAEQSTMVMGMGRDPRIEHLLKLGQEAKIPKARMNDMIDRVKAALSQWRALARSYGVDGASIDLIDGRINQPRR